MTAQTDQVPLSCSPLSLSSLAPHTQDTLGGISELWVYSIPLTVQFRGITRREGLLMRGEAGWGEAAPFAEYTAEEASKWLDAALNSAHTPPPTARRDSIPVNVTIPVISPDQAYDRVLCSGGCTTAKVKVADPRSSLREDCERVEAVADALQSISGQDGRVRIDVNGMWDIDTAVTAIRELDRASSAVDGLEYVEQPCATVEELAELRRKVSVRIAADESIRRAEDPVRVAALEAADIAVIKVAPLGGIGRALEIAFDTGLDVVLSSAVETSIGIGMGIQAAAAVDHLPFACGLATVQLLTADVTSTPLLPVNGHIPCRNVSPDLLGSHARPVSEDRVTWWMNRLNSMC